MPERVLGVMYQDESYGPPDGWYFDFLDGTRPNQSWERIEQDDLVISPSNECWKISFVGQRDLNGWVRSQAHGPLGTGFWSYPHKVPEPEVSVMLLAGLILLAMFRLQKGVT
jgi:hypothetical protein